MKIKIGVFFGGQSVEHEISIISAVQAIHAFDKQKYDIVPIYIAKNGNMYTGSAINDIEEYKSLSSLITKSQRILLINEEGKFNLLKYPLKKFGNNIIDYIDVAFPIVHGTNVEDGTLQGYLKTIGIPFVGCDVLSSAMGMDKYVQKAILEKNNVPVLDCISLSSHEYEAGTENLVSLIEDNMKYPVIVKPINLGSSIGIKKAENSDELADAIDHAFGFALKILVEPAIKSLREINCSVLGDSSYAEASECEEPISTDDILSFDAKYIDGGKKGPQKGMASAKRKIPAEIPDELRERIRENAVKAFKLLDCCGVARIDFMLDEETGELWFNEINTIPGSLSFYLWEPMGLTYDKLLDKLVTLALKRHREQANIVYTFESSVLSGMKLGGSKGIK